MPVIYVVVEKKQTYGFGRFLLDLFLIHITGGLWLLYLILRHLFRSNTR